MHTRDEAIKALRKADARICAWELDDGIAEGDDPTSNIRWHTVALEGDWEGHWQGGFRVAREHLEQIVANFEGLKNDTVVDYEHATCLGPFVGKAPAAGWIDRMQVREGEGGARLSARVKWTNTAAGHIREREYRYVSPVIAFRTPDRVTGQDLGASVPSVALTNTPFLDELPEVTLNSLMTSLVAEPPEQTQEDRMFKPEQYKALALSLGLGEQAAPEDIITAVESAQQDSTSLPRLCTALGVDEGASADDMIAAAERLSSQQVPEGIDLQQLAADAAQVREMRADAAVERAKKAGKITASNEAWCRKLALSDGKAFSEWESAAPVMVPVGVKQPPAGRERSLSFASTDEPTDEDIKRLCAIADVKAEAKKAQIGVESYVRANFFDLSRDYA